MRPRWSLIVLVVSLCAASVSVSGPAEKGASLANRIQELKASGQRVPAELLAKARAEYHERAIQTRNALLRAPLDGGSSDANATLITSNPFIDSGTTVGKGNNASVPSCLSGGSNDAEDAWYRLDLAFDSELTTWLTCSSSGPSSYDTRIAVFDSNLTLLACNDDAPDCGGPDFQSRISDFTLIAGTYYVVVDGFSGAAGPYEFNASWVITTGGCAEGSDRLNPEIITAIPFVASGTTVGACHNFTLDCELGGGGAAPDYWYHVSLDTTVLIDVWTQCDSLSIDTRIAVLDSNLNQLYCNDDDPSCATSQSGIRQSFLSPGGYFIVVEGPDLSEGPFTLLVDTMVVTPSSNPSLLPDIIVRESDLFDNDIVTDIEPGRTHLRLSNGTANVGDGKFHIYGTGVDNGDGTENIMQRVFQENGSFFDRTAGQFVFHNSHNHIHVQGWSAYRLREVLPGDGVGAEVAKGEKTSFCILDLAIHDSSLPNFDPSGEFFSCSSTTQGLTVGWVDIYSKGLPDQNIDITDVPDGTYWLESEVDPNDWFLEKDETNNITRIKVTIGNGPEINPDPYEPNDTIAAVDARPAGGPNSPNLGPCNPQRVISNLTVHVAGNDDYFKFYANHAGASGDFVSVSFDSTLGNLDIALLDSTGAAVDSSITTTEGVETVQLAGRAEGWYYVRVFSPTNDLITNYRLVVDPPSNAVPAIVAGEPATGTQTIVHGLDAFTVTWSASDPEGDQTWVSVYYNTTPAFDGNEAMIPTSLFTPGELGFHVVNSAYLGIDTYYFYFEVTDGGTTIGEWSNGTLRVVDEATAVSGVPTARIELYAPYPNPFNPRTTLSLSLGRKSHVLWRIYDVRGALVAEVENRELPAGMHQRSWNGTDTNGRAVVSGVYFQRVVAGDFVQTKKLTLIK